VAEERLFKFTNAGVTTLSAGINNSVTSISVTSGAVLPDPADGEIATLVLRDNANSKFEIMNITARTGNNLTVERGAEGTTAEAWANGTKVENSLTAAFFIKLATPSAAMFRTSKPYPITVLEALDGLATLRGAQPSYSLVGDDRAEAVDNLASMLEGTLDVVLVTYSDGAPEAIDNTAEMLSGDLDSVLVSYEDGLPEAIDNFGSMLSGELDVVLVTYPNSQVEAIDNTGSILSGDLT
jgi:hypothetical protein